MPKQIWLALALVWTVFVTVLCLVSFGDLPTVNVSGVDKYVHATFHFIFALLWFRYLKTDVRALLTSVIIVFSMSVVFGILLEILQGLLTQTRQADAKDVAANCSGALVALGIQFLYEKWRIANR